MKTMSVVATKHPVPTYENSRRYIESEPVQVTLNSYYRRRLAAGELEEYVPPARTAKKASAPASAPAPAPEPTPAPSPAPSEPSASTEEK